MNEPTTVVVGNLTADPELRYTQSGTAVATFTVAQTPRKLNRQTGEWEDDGDTLFMRCVIWRDYAVHVSSSLSKGMRVMAFGRLGQKSYDNRDGIKVTYIEMQVDDVGPCLRNATAHVTRANDQSARGGIPPQQQQRPAAPVDDPWATPQTDSWATAPLGTDDGYGDETPF